MNTIPNIQFNSTEGATDIEFLSLSELFSRIDGDLEHDPRQLHRITFFALLIVTEGSGEHQIDLERFRIEKGTVLKIAKGQVHAFRGKLQYKGYLVIFTEDFVLKYFSRSSIELISHLYNYHISDPLVKNCDFNNFFLEQAIAELQNKNTYAQKEIIAKMLELYLLRLERLARSTMTNKLNKEHYPLFLQFKNLVESTYHKTRNVKDYAEQMRISTKHLNQIVQEFTLNTAKTFIDNYVVLEIKRMLFSSNLSIKEIAYAIGFDEVTNFTKFFKKHTGFTPNEYKKNF
ncbi:MAG: AraC family transcriptional regulator [Muricauda sp.]|nr:MULTISPECIES: helix-turn-helix transcriptional regulator [unclassified Allomuricauda]MAU16129.1 AraC family transcriptional regulator [Allomuricauda sp.]